MAYSKDSSAAFTGGSGQLAVMSELLQRQCNAAIPLIDIGTDVFAFRDDREEVARIQVKTAGGKPDSNRAGYRADFRIPIAQLRRTDSPPLFYALAVRLASEWGSMLVISRAKLQSLREAGCGTEINSARTKQACLKLYVQFSPTSVEEKTITRALCGKTDLSRYVNAWESLPPFREPVAIELPARHAERG